MGICVSSTHTITKTNATWTPSGEQEPARSHTTITRHKYDTMVKRGRKAAFHTPAVL